jgi:hypothetical protein
VRERVYVLDVGDTSLAKFECPLATSSFVSCST